MHFSFLNFESLQRAVHHMPKTGEWQIRGDHRNSAGQDRHDEAIQQDAPRQSMLVKPTSELDESPHNYLALLLFDDA